MPANRILPPVGAPLIVCHAVTSGQHCPACHQPVLRLYAEGAGGERLVERAYTGRRVWRFTIHLCPRPKGATYE